VDTDYNYSDVLLEADPIFIVMENFFCIYFTFEWVCRWCAFEKKRNAFKDAWFDFDTVLVVMMVGETWILSLALLILFPGGGGSNALGSASILKLVRLLRLSRMARMARLLRAMPELMVLIKGMVVAMRSVFFTLCLLACLMYIFGIALVQLLKDTDVGDNSFAKVPAAMNTLLLQGILPDQAEVIDSVAEEGWVFKCIILLYVVVAGLCVMNMLVGVLCEVVCVVSAVEKESLLLTYVRTQLQNMLQTSGIDADGDSKINKQEFGKLLELPEACRAIQEVGVDVVGLMDFTDFIFKDGKELSFPDFMDMVLQLRGTNVATVKDIVDLRKLLISELERANDENSKIISEALRAFSAMGAGAMPTPVAVTNMGLSEKGKNTMSWAASAASRLSAAASELSAAAGELSSSREKAKLKKVKDKETVPLLKLEDLSPSNAEGSPRTITMCE